MECFLRCGEYRAVEVETSGPFGEALTAVCARRGVSAVFSINRLAIPFSQAVGHSAPDYRRTLEDALRLIFVAEKMK